MILEKIQHHLTLFFIILLVITQSLVFVAGRAAINLDDSLQVVFIEPIAGSEIVKGTQVDLQAMLSTREDKDFSLVYFSISNETQEINFEASLQTDGAWISKVALDTNDLELGEYRLITIAQIYNANGEMEEYYRSDPQTIKIVAQGEVALSATGTGHSSFVAPTTNQTISTSSVEVLFTTDETINNLLFALYQQATSTNLYNTVIQDNILPQVSSLGYTHTFTGLVDGNYYLVATNQSSSNLVGDDAVLLEANRTNLAAVYFAVDLPTASSIIALETAPVTINITQPTVSSVVDKELTIQVKVSEALSASSVLTATINYLAEEKASLNLEKASDLEYGVVLDVSEYTNGNYELVVADNSTLVANVNFTINNTIVNTITLNSPLNSLILDDGVQLNITTNFEVNELTIQLVNTEQPAISTDLVTIPRTNGLNWVQTIYLDEELINGEYDLMITALNDDAPVEKTFPIQLNRQDQLPLDLSSVTLELQDLGNNISNLVNLEVISNTRFNELSFFILNSIDRAEVLKVPAVGQPLHNSLNNTYRSSAILDTTELANGNYYIYAGVVDNTDTLLVASNELLVSVFNELAESTTTGEGPAEDNSVVVPPIINSAETRELIGQNVAVDLFTSCFEANISETDCDNFKAIISNVVNTECLKQAIYDEVACEDYLNRVSVDLECQDNNIINSEACKDYLMEKYAGNVECQLDNVQSCSNILRENYLNRLVMAKKKQNTISEVITPLIGQSIKIDVLAQQLQTSGLEEDVLPISAVNTTSVLVAKSQAKVVLENESRLTMINPAVLLIDTDGDGLSDDLEIYYGTNVNNQDTDGDSYPDGLEIRNNYNPLGEGILMTGRTDFDKVILANLVLEQPQVVSPQENSSLTIDNIVAINDQELNFNGQATPDTWLTIYLYSDLPLVMVTKTDTSGDWSYTINKSLVDGQHRIYVAINNDTGQIVQQSAPVSFLVKAAQAVSPDNYFDKTITVDKTNSRMIYYILGAAFLIFVLGIIFFLHRHRNPKIEV